MKTLVVRTNLAVMQRASAAERRQAQALAEAAAAWASNHGGQWFESVDSFRAQKSWTFLVPDQALLPSFLVDAVRTSA